MLNASQKNEYRSELFRHLDGIGIAPVAYALHEKGVLDFILKNDSSDVDEMAEHFGANNGYLNVGLRMLASQGWINYEVDNSENKVTITKNERSEIAFGLVGRFEEVVAFMKN